MTVSLFSPSANRRPAKRRQWVCCRGRDRLLDPVSLYTVRTMTTARALAGCAIAAALMAISSLAPADTTAMSASLASWLGFTEVPAALAGARSRGWRLAILSNCDRDLIASSLPKLGAAFDDVIVAQDVGSYKPAPGHWQRFAERHPDALGRHVHVGASTFHDVAPATELRLPTVWINRLGEPADAHASAELPDLSALPNVLDELLPA